MAAEAVSHMQAVRTLARRRGLLRPRDLKELGLPEEYLHQLWQVGELERVGRGLYLWPEAELTQHHSLVEAAVRVPQGVVCLLSALRFHELGTQDPDQVWLALPRGAWRPVTDLPLRIVTYSEVTFDAGVEGHPVQGVELRVYSAAKTLVDCFKYRNKIGLDVALEALQEGWRERRFELDELWQYAALSRMQRVMAPYLEMLTCGS